MDDLRSNHVKKVLVVDDSAFMRKVITDILNEHSGLTVVGTARNGKEAIEKTRTLQPDVVTLDVEMPIMSGLDALLEIMKTNPVPVVMLSSTTKNGTENTMLAMEYGAVDFIEKPGGSISLNLHKVKEEIIEKVIAAASVSSVKLKSLEAQKPPLKSKIASTDFHSKQEGDTQHISRKNYLSKISSKTQYSLVLIGTSTGGPRALQEVLTKLPKNFPTPILIVQHMPPKFTKSLANRLNDLCNIQVKEAEHGEALKNGTAYIAPGGAHLSVKKLGTSYFAQLDDQGTPRQGHRPSVDVLFESVAQLKNINCVAIVMTGMGSDGEAGMRKLKQRNKQTISIAESQRTSVVYGMPKAIVTSNLADEVVDVEDISSVLIDVLRF